MAMRGHFGVGIYHPKKEVNVGSLYRAAHLYGADYIFTVGKRYKHQHSDTTKAAHGVPLFHFRDIDDLVSHMPHGSSLVGVELDERSTSLHRYRHRHAATYLLGAEDHGLSDEVLDKCHDVVEIPTANPWSMNVACAGSIVMADRFRQMGVAG